MRILVTGGAGFIGSAFVRYTLRQHPKDSVTVVDLLTYAGSLENLGIVQADGRFKFVKADICDAQTMNELVSKVDAVVHFAAESHVDRSIEDPSTFVRTNVLGTQVLLDACRKNGNVRFHHVSTDEVFGSLGMTGAFNELSPYDPRSPYSASKAAADHLVRAAFHTYGLPVTISNCSNNYGPYQHPEKLIPLAVTNLVDGKAIPIYGDGMNVRDWLHVDDHCEGIDLVLRNGKIGEAYYFGGRSERSNAEIARLILFEMGFDAKMMVSVRDRAGHDKRYAIDPSKAERELGWSARMLFLHGLRKTIEWYRLNESWWRTKKKSGV
jgi:dTDP-glucose 4,6-dehydratase